MSDIVTLVQLVNTLLITLSKVGLSWNQFSARIAAAEAEGREFDANDVRVVLAEFRAKLDALEAALDAEQ